MKPLIQILAVLYAAAATAQDAAGPSEQDWKIHVELKVYTIPAKQLRPILPDLRDEAKMEAAAAKLETMVDSGAAEIVAVLASETLHDNEVKLFQGEELRYPIEFEGAYVVEPLAKAPAAQPAKVGPGEGHAVAFPATVFETREIGVTLEVTPSISTDGQRFFVYAEPARTWFLRWDEFEVGRFANNEKIVVKQPRLATANSSGTFGMTSGQRVLLGVHYVPGSRKQMEVMLLRIWSTPRKTK